MSSHPGSTPSGPLAGAALGSFGAKFDSLDCWQDGNIMAIAVSQSIEMIAGGCIGGSSQINLSSPQRRGDAEKGERMNEPQITRISQMKGASGSQAR
jgi:hypothetical protein